MPDPEATPPKPSSGRLGLEALLLARAANPASLECAWLLQPAPRQQRISPQRSFPGTAHNAPSVTSKCLPLATLVANHLSFTYYEPKCSNKHHFAGDQPDESNCRNLTRGQAAVSTQGQWPCLLLSSPLLRRWHCMEMMNERNIPAK